MENASVYDHIAEQGFHFPDWLVTDYVLSLATKPLVILSGISGTGKTKMAQLVAEHVAPDVTAEVITSHVPTPDDSSFVHRVGLATERHKVITIPKDAVPLLENPPEPGRSYTVQIRLQGQVRGFEAKLMEASYGALAPVYQFRWRKDLQQVLSGLVRQGDYLVVKVVPENDTVAFELAPVPAERHQTAVTSQRIGFLSVRPDWTDNRSLLGYYNPIAEQYQGTELLKLMLRAQANPDEPHMVIVDEMNLAKVEYYFSDFLSAVEADAELVLHDAGESLPLGDGTLVPERLRVPQNLFFTGTVNVDETTYMFSPKVLDRANTLEFNDVDLSSYGSGETPDAGYFRLRPGVSVEGLLAAYRKPTPQDWRKLPADYADRLRALHGLMAKHNLHFGYRVANEIARYMNLAAEFVGSDGLETAYDLQVLQKVLPKLSGSRAKLEAPLTALAKHLAQEGLPLSTTKVERMLSTVKSVGFVSFVE